MTMPSNSAVRALRPSLVVAEALVDRQGPAQIVSRARRLGFSADLTKAVVGVCCGQQHCDAPATANTLPPSTTPTVQS
ncbi:MAG: hypothetical protein H0T72_10850 [Chloroflexia bacterium]|jgi:hypothetical protein|nr:hypothetical protein [Chloroflexia bacterium]